MTEIRVKYHNPLFSIIVPTYNEERDLPKTLDALMKLDYPDYEVVMVDDASKDKTVQVALPYANSSERFRILRQSQNRGVATARNRGIHEAKGTVVLILNADVILPSDYLSRLADYYRNGKEWVAVRSRVMNLDTIYSRFTAAEEYSFYFIENRHWVWSEGFSCTKEAARSVGLFPESMPGCSGEDVDFGLQLEKKFPGVKTTEIEAPHIAPDDLPSFWRQQAGRGKGRTNTYHYMKGYGLIHLGFSTLLSIGWRFMKLLFGFPIWKGWRICRYSKKGRNDFLPFIWVDIVRQLAMILGMAFGYSRILFASRFDQVKA